MDTNPSQRAIISITNDDAANLVRYMRKAYGESQEPIAGEWLERFERIYAHMCDRIPIHFTDLGIAE